MRHPRQNAPASSSANSVLLRQAALSCAVVALLVMGGCAGTEDTIGQVLVAPGYYEFYNCQQLAAAAKPLRVRLQELDELMTKSSSGAGGGLVNAMAYQPDYLSVRGQLNELSRTATAKNCDEREIAGQPAKPAVQKPPSDLTKPVR